MSSHTGLGNILRQAIYDLDKQSMMPLSNIKVFNDIAHSSG